MKRLPQVIKYFCLMIILTMNGLVGDEPAGFLLAKNGLTKWKIVYAGEEEFAAKELSSFLKKITGADFPVEQWADGISGTAFYLGETELARKAGAKFSQFEPDEWFVKGIPAGIIIAGGANKGTLYGVYELLERYGNCFWPAWDMEVIPKNPLFELPGNLLITGKPAYTMRTIYDGVTYGNKKFNREVLEQKCLFNIRNRETAARGTQQFDTTNQYYYAHNFYLFVAPQKYFKSNPEYFSMNKEGERVIGRTLHVGSQLCLSNPEVAEITAATLKKYIEEERSALPKNKWPSIYPIIQNDDTNYICKCPECSALSEKEGGDSALLILYLNRVLDEIAEQYPEIRIMTSFYVSTENVPESFRPHKNMICQWIDLYTRSDCYRPIESKFNAERKEQFDAWVKTGATLAIWDYWNMGGASFDTPRIETMVDAIAPDLKYFHQNGVRRYFTEAEDYTRKSGYPQNFLDLQYFVGRRLLIDPYQEPEALIEKFMRVYYGSAYEPMLQVLNAVRNGIAGEPTAMPTTNCARTYQSSDFLRKVMPLLEEARQLTEAGSICRRHVEKEMPMILAAALNMTGFLQGAERTELRKLFRELTENSIMHYIATEYQKEKLELLNESMQRYEISQLTFATPEPFQGIPEDRIHIYAWPHFKNLSRKPEDPIVINDAASPVGKAVIPPAEIRSAFEKFRPHSFGAYDYGTKKNLAMELASIPQDEKYHWHYVGEYLVQPGSFFWAFRWVLQAPFTGVWKNSDGIIDGNKWHIYVSAKFTGPVYVPDSKEKNELYIDYVVLSKEKTRITRP